MARFSIIGTGSMANAIGGLLADGGNDVTYVARDEVGTKTLGDVVVLALPYGAVEAVLAAYGDDGRLTWARRTPAGLPGQLAVTPQASVYVAGRYDGTRAFFAGEPGETTLASSGGFDLFVARLAP